MNRGLAAAVRRFADHTSARIDDSANSRQIVATITSVTPGAAPDGNSLVTVNWRGSVLTVNGYNRTYTPVAGHRVVCDYIDNQLFISYSPVGQP